MRKVASRQAKRSTVLPAVQKSGRTIHRAKDLLDDGQRRSLRKDLDRLAQIRRDAEASSSTFRLS